MKNRHQSESDYIKTHQTRNALSKFAWSNDGYVSNNLIRLEAL